MRVLRATILAITLLPPGAGLLNAQEVIDRIVARVDTDIILLSDVRELSRYQQFVDGRSESDAEVLERLIDQWIVRTEAKASLFPLPSDEDVNRSLERLQRSFSSQEAYEERKKRGQTPPTLEAARDFIQEALVQRAINVQADKWLKESRARLHVENLLSETSK